MAEPAEAGGTSQSRFGGLAAGARGLASALPTGAVVAASAAAERVSAGADGAKGVANTVYGKVSEGEGSGMPGAAASSAMAVGAVAAGAAAAASRAAAGSAAGAATTAGRAVAGSAAGAAASAADAAELAKEEMVSAVLHTAMATKGRAKEIVDNTKDLFERWAKRNLYALIQKLVERLPGVAKSLLEDPQMPRAVSRGKDRLVDAMWPDIRKELLWEVAVLLDKDKQDDPEERELAASCACLAFFRYRLFPFDKSIWGQLKDPVYWVLRVVSMIPVYGVSPIFYLFVFLVIDRTDEFQLIQFILFFKGTQFISAGFIRAITGLALFYMCLTAHSDPSHHTCEEDGPGNNTGMWLTLFGFVIQVCLCWVAFFLLYWSHSKGRSSLQGNMSSEQLGEVGLAKKGAYIKVLLWYDLFSALVCAGFAAALTFMRDDPISMEREDIWPIEHIIYAALCVYGMLQVPFFFFTLPGLNRVLTHAVPTAYDPQGRCLQPRRPPPPSDEKVKEKLNIREMLVSEDDVNKLLEKLRVVPIPGVKIMAGMAGAA